MQPCVSATNEAPWCRSVVLLRSRDWPSASQLCPDLDFGYKEKFGQVSKQWEVIKGGDKTPTITKKDSMMQGTPPKTPSPPPLKEAVAPRRGTRRWESTSIVNTASTVSSPQKPNRRQSNDREECMQIAKRWESTPAFSAPATPKRPNRRQSIDREDCMQQAKRWESMSGLASSFSSNLVMMASPKKPNRRQSNDRSKCMQQAKRWESTPAFSLKTASPKKPNRRQSNDRNKCMQQAKRWESTPAFSLKTALPKKPNRRQSNDRSKCMQQAKRWESLSAINMACSTSPTKPCRQRSNDNLQATLWASWSHSLAPPPFCDDDDDDDSASITDMCSNKMGAPSRWESMSSSLSSMNTTGTFGSINNSKPHRKASVKGSMSTETTRNTLFSSRLPNAAVTKNANDDSSDRRRKIMTSRNWQSLRTSQLTMNRRRSSLMTEAQRWESTASNLSIAKPPRRDSLEEKVGQLKSNDNASLSSRSVPTTESAASTRGRKLVNARGWQSFLDRKTYLPRKAFSTSEISPSTPPFHITTMTTATSQEIQSARASLDKIQKLRESIKERRDAFASKVASSRRKLNNSLDDKETSVNSMDANRVFLMSKFKALNKGMDETLARRRARLASCRSLLSSQGTILSLPPSVTNSSSSSSMLSRRHTDNTILDETHSSLSSNMDEDGWSSCDEDSRDGEHEGAIQKAIGLAEYFASTTPTTEKIRARRSVSSKTSDRSQKLSLPELLSVNEDDEDISDYFEDDTSSVDGSN